MMTVQLGADAPILEIPRTVESAGPDAILAYVKAHTAPAETPAELSSSPAADVTPSPSRRSK